MNAMSRTISTIQMMRHNNIIHNNAPLQLVRFYNRLDAADLHNRRLIAPCGTSCASAAALRAVQIFPLIFGPRRSRRENIVNRLGYDGRSVPMMRSALVACLPVCRGSGGRADGPAEAAAAENTTKTIQLRGHQSSPNRLAAISAATPPAANQIAAQCRA